MTDAAKEARREYYRKYREKNRERIRQKAIERWERIARETGQANNESTAIKTDSMKDDCQEEGQD